MKWPAHFWYPHVMRYIMGRPFSLTSLAIVTLAGTALLTLPIRSQQGPGNNRIQAATIFQLQVPSLPQQNSTFPANTAQAQVSASSEEGAGVTVVLDPAHGGADFGARGPTGLAESDVVLDFARAARIALEAQRLRVLLTREGNQDPSFDNRSAMVNGLRNAVLISLHVSSSGPVGTARTYYYAFPSDPAPATNAGASGASGATSATGAVQGLQTPATTSTSQGSARRNLIEWDHAQRSSVEFSRQLAALAQTELLRRFRGSPETPIAAPVRQLRTVAVPAIAIEVSSIDVTDAKRLDQMAQPLAEAIGKAVAEFHYPVNTPAAPNVPAAANAPAAANTPAAAPSGVR
jgi:N-acetylmuramoyl-L-alanine amidase